LIGPNSKNLFYNRELNLNQGAYLTPAPAELVATLNDAYLRLTGKPMIEIPEQDQQIETDTKIGEEREPTPTFSAPLSEKDLLEYIQRYIAAKGYYFEKETLYNYHICLKTRPFVILAGLSGTGKSKLPKLYAEALGHTFENKHYLRLPVRPTWNDDRYLLGYLNTITGEYMTESAVDFVIKAENDFYNLYFFCLDEMNLAHVEYYFSQFLSALEEDEPHHRTITLLNEKTLERLTAHNSAIDVPSTILISPNLLITGTVVSYVCQCG
jgi:5-methylcytosine-specific restriction endonuclease McrBC GTP-binding regulatory subunit McrB